MSNDHPAGFAPMAPFDAVTRALAQRWAGIYQLGGGAHFMAGSVYDATDNRFPGHCDCTGLMAYALMYRRNQWNTDAIVKDAIGSQTRFHLVSKDDIVSPGDMLVTGNLESGPDHAGMVCKVLPGFERGSVVGGREWWRGVMMVHCSGAGQLTPDPEKPGKNYGATRINNAYRWRAAHDGHYSRFIRANHLQATMDPKTVSNESRLDEIIGLGVIGACIIAFSV